MTRIPLFQIFVCLCFLIGGCTQAKDLGRYVKHNVQGEHYLSTKKYARGYEVFSNELQNNTPTAQTHYYLGRYLLAQNKNKEALNHLKQTVLLEPKNADYNFWLGVCYGENGLLADERKSYQQALSLKKDHLQALIYLAHNELKNKQYTRSLQTYEKALHIWPESPSSLYNRALILNILKRTPEEKIAWLSYLNLYPAGALARKATDHLNRLSDFSYRNHHIGARTVTLAKIRFDPFRDTLDKSSFPSLNLVGAAASNMAKGTLQVVVYQKNNKELAHKKAISIKKYLQKEFPELKAKNRIRLSWFGESESFTIAGRKLIADESVRFFLTDLK